MSVFGIRLGISRVVGKPEKRGIHLVYLEDGKWMIPERIILTRWRKKAPREGETYHGFRLPPGTWQTLRNEEFEDFDWHHASVDDVRRVLARVRRRSPTLGAPGAPALLVLGRHLEDLAVLSRVLERERDSQHPGLPDLFLYRRKASRFIEGEKFVEVKSPSDRLSKQQIEELEFLRNLGLGAGVVRLIERADSAPKPGKTSPPGKPESGDGGDELVERMRAAGRRAGPPALTTDEIMALTRGE